MNPQRQKERESEQMKAIPLIMGYEMAGEDMFPKRDQTGAKNQGQSEQAKKDFFAEASPQGTMSADWRAVSDNVSPLVKRGGTVVDLGGSSGRYGEFLALSRPDLKIIVIEPDRESFLMAQENLKKQGLLDRVTLINKPVPAALEELRKNGTPVDMITSIYRTHMQTDAENVADMKAMGALSKRTGASIITHDLHRPTDVKTVKLMAAIYPADTATTEFRDGYEQGMKSSYRGTEMERLLRAHIGGIWEDRVARPLGQMQMHIQRGANAAAPGEAPNPNYPPTDPEYIKVADDMNMIMKAGGVVDLLTTTPQKAVTGLCDKFGISACGTKPVVAEVPETHRKSTQRTLDAILSNSQ